MNEFLKPLSCCYILLLQCLVPLVFGDFYSFFVHAKGNLLLQKKLNQKWHQNCSLCFSVISTCHSQFLSQLKDVSTIFVALYCDFNDRSSEILTLHRSRTTVKKKRGDSQVKCLKNKKQLLCFLFWLRLAYSADTEVFMWVVKPIVHEKTAVGPLAPQHHSWHATQWIQWP